MIVYAIYSYVIVAIYKVWQEIKCYFCILAHILSNVLSQFR